MRGFHATLIQANVCVDTQPALNRHFYDSRDNFFFRMAVAGSLV